MNWIKQKYKYFYELPKQRSVSWFSLLFAGCFCVLMLQLDIQMNLTYRLLIGLLLFTIVLVFGKVARTIFAFMSLITYPIGLVVSFILMFFLFFLVFTPIGLFRNRKFTGGWKKSIEAIDNQKLYE